MNQTGHHQPDESDVQQASLAERPLRDRGALWWLLPFAAFGGMLAITWRTWADPAVDFGQMLYVAWQYSEGTQSYSDINTLRGPFSSYVNALWFKLLGPGIMTVAWANILLTAATAGLIGWAYSGIAGRWGGIAAATVFVTVFACGDYAVLGSYNFICPYVQGVTHGVLLSFASLGFALRYCRRFDLASIGFAAFFAGAAVLTKAEITLAIIAAVLTAFLSTSWQRRNVKTSMRHGGFAFLVFFVPSLLLGCVMFVLDRDAMVRGLLGEWPYIIEGKAADLPLYRWLMGTDAPAKNIALMVKATTVYVAIFSLWFVLARQAHRACKPWQGAMVASLITLVVVAFLYNWLGLSMLLHLGRPLPLLMFAAAIFAIAILWRHDQKKAAGVLVASVFSLALLAKIVLNARITDYGFSLAMPATTLLVAMVIGVIPGIAQRHRFDPRTIIAGGLVAIVMLSSGFVYVTANRAASKTFEVGQGRDLFYADGRGESIEKMRLLLAERTTSDDTLLCLPDAVMINYLARRRTSTHYVNYVPTLMAIFGQQAMLADLQKSPPDFLIIAHRDTSDCGFRYFGIDYGLEIQNWLDRNYAGRTVIGAMPATSNRYGLLLAERAGGARSEESPTDAD